MSAFLDYLSANDNEVYDLLVSGKQRITERVLRELARDRGIFCSPDESRDELADYLSILPQGYHDIVAIIDKREPGNRREKTTSIRLDSTIGLEEIKEAARTYSESVSNRETVVSRPKSTGGFSVDVEYDEFNRSKTRLLQRTRQKAEIEFFEVDGQTVVRMSATEKANKIVAALKENIERSRKSTIEQEAIELTSLTTPELRSKFFTKLISSLPRFRLRNVMSLKVSSHLSEDGEEDAALDLDSETEAEAGAEMFAAIVHSMHLSGQNLVQSQEYKSLIERGFYITEISWRSEIDGSPPDIVQFDAGFQDRKAGKGFRYSVQGAFRAHKDGHRKTIAAVGDAERLELLTAIEVTARTILKELQEELKTESGEPEEVCATVEGVESGEPV